MSTASMDPLHPLELRILLVVANGPAHGYRIVQEIEAAEGEHFKLYPANLYRRMRDLADRGLLEEVPPPATDDPAGRPRTYFGVTPEGRRAVASERTRLEALLRDTRRALSAG